jgi:hypothetical protein
MNTAFPTGFNTKMTQITTDDLYLFGIDLGRFLATIQNHLSPNEVKSTVESFLQTVREASILNDEEIRATFLARVQYGYALEENL